MDGVTTVTDSGVPPDVPTTKAGRQLLYIHGERMREPVLAIEAAARASQPLTLDDLESISLALQAFPTWFEETADKVHRLRELALETAT